MSKHHILIVDDDKRIRSLLDRYLSSNGYLVTTTTDSKDAWRALELFTFDLIILDVMLPGELGTEFAKKLRSISDVVILMLTAVDGPQDRIEGLKSGADDYLAKPFEPEELLLRIEKLLARHSAIATRKQTSSFGQVKFDSEKNLFINNTEVTPLTANELKLLQLLLANKNTLTTRESLGNALGISPRSVDVQIMHLRSKIERDPKNPVYLRSSRGQGYVLYVDS